MTRRLVFFSVTVITSFFLWNPTPVFASSPEAVVCASQANKVYFLDQISATLIGSPTDVGQIPAYVTITPDAKYAWVSQVGSNISIVDIASNTLVDTITTGNAIVGIAITPDNTLALATLYANGTVEFFDVATHALLETVAVGQGPRAIAITPDGTQALVCNYTDATITIIDIASKSVVDTVHTSSNPNAIAITPDGRQAWICHGVPASAVSIIDIASRSIVDTINAGINNPLVIAITPDNTQAWVGNGNGNATIVEIASHSMLATINFGSWIQGVAIRPDIAQVWVTDLGGSVMAIDQVTHSILHTVSLPSHSSPAGIAFTPDQAPTARFIAATQDHSVAFDASNSSSPFGGIATYTWNFGDGSPEVIATNPRISHTYTDYGTYTVSLVVTNTSGTSTRQTFTGQTVSNNGGPSAKSSQQIMVGFAPTKFLGKTKIHHHPKKALLKTKWTKSASQNVARYKIYAHKKKVASVSAQHSTKHTLTLHPQHFPRKHISKKYKRYLENKYSIRAVNANGAVSAPTPLHVVR